MADSAASGRRRVRARVTGVVQGVGFRPYVFRLAAELGLGGWVFNDERGVELEVEGGSASVDAFLARLPAEAPPLASVEAVDAQPADPRGEREFRIVESRSAGGARAQVAADSATCVDCLAELADPADRRHRYPFINCTNCGPRFTIITGVPYDRRLTTMAGFTMCEPCRAEYDDPADRRFHAQPNACPACGPAVSLVDRSGDAIGLETAGDAIEAAAALLARGRLLAVKGVGGYHLACLATEASAVDELRARKDRDSKPLALMASSLEAARRLVELTEADQRLLCGPERPIVIARRRPRTPIAAGVAPRSRDLGVMLAYSPLHQVLCGDLLGMVDDELEATLVMTSGNLADEPIAYRDDDALGRLGEIADGFLIGGRPIHMRTDDSVVRSLDPEIRDAPILIRRSRGYVPRSLELPLSAERPLLGCGAELKSTFCVAKGDRAWVSHHIGDLKNWETLSAYREGVEHFQRLFDVSPLVVAHDLHPDYLATGYALERDGVEQLAVQHHHAHLAACLAEHGELGPAVGAIFDGAGFGPDGTVWGGEILVGGLAGYERAGLLFPVRLPGGDAATAAPWRMACSWLVAALGEPEPPIPPALRGLVAPGDWAAVCRMVGSGIGSPLSTSAGRLFDAVAALCGIRAWVGHEGQAATELEGIADLAETAAYPVELLRSHPGQPGQPGTPGESATPAILDPRAAILALRSDLELGVALPLVAARFHNGLAAATADACAAQAAERGVATVVLSGGVFQNRLLLERTAARLRQAGMRVLFPRRLPPNDGGISYGQVAVAAASSQ